MTESRDRATVRKALRAGGVVSAVAAAVGVALVLSVQIPIPAAIATAIVLGAFVTAGWLLLAYLLDLVAGEQPDRRRTRWTVAAALVAALGPFLLIGAFLSGSGGGS